MLPSFADFFKETKSIFHSTNNDQALIKLLAFYDSIYLDLDPLVDHNKLYLWQTRALPKQECEAIISGNQNNVIDYINRLDENNKDTLINALKDMGFNATQRNVANKFHEILLDICKSKRKLPTSAEIRYDNEKKLDQIYGSRIIISQNKKCACCGGLLAIQGKINSNKIYKNYHIVKARKDIDENFENLVALCNSNCYIDYLDNYDTDLENKLVKNKNKANLVERKLHIRENDKIDEQIYQVLKKVKINYKSYSIAEQEEYNITKIRNKISEDNDELFKKIKNHCDVSYGYIKNLLTSLDTDDTNTYSSIRKDVKTCFEDYNKLHLPQYTIFINLVDWLLFQTGFDEEYREAAERIVSFFVQICEVYNEISK